MNTITLQGEDHTLANMVTKNLLKNPEIKYAAFHKEHPSDTFIKIVYETENPLAFQKSNQELLTILETLSKKINKLDTVCFKI
jgi:DNA-directed RNA polymerase subunit L